MSWNDDRIATLKKMWQQGKSASEIAEKLGGITRNAVIGKAHRLGLSGRPSPVTPASKTPAAKKAAPAPANKKQAVPPPPKMVPPAAPAPKKSYLAPKAATPAAVPAKKGMAAPVAVKPAPAPAKAQPSKPNAPGKPPEPVVLAAMANQTSRSDGKVLSILDLKERMCRWPVGDPKESGFGYCGGVSITGHPYCAEHVAIAFQAPNRKDGKKPKEIKMADAPELEDLEIEVEDDADAEDDALADDLDDEEDEAVEI